MTNMQSDHTKNIEIFKSKIIAEMADAGVEVEFNEDTHVLLGENLLCNGYFDDSKPKYAVAVGKSEELWLPICVHEYAHFTQWRDKAPEWTNTTIDGIYYDDFLDLWIPGKVEYTEDQVNRFVDAGIAVEADCERRTIKLIREYDLPIDPITYAQMSNAYIHFYNYIRLYRKWYEAGKEPYRLEEVWSNFNVFIDDVFPVRREYIEIFEKYCFDK